MKLKICGQNDVDFAVHAARCGVDYLGFIFHPTSPRCVTVDQVVKIAESLRSSTSPRNVNLPALVGVFVKQSVDEILATMRAAALDVVQLHRRATAEEVAALKAAGYEVWTLAGGAHGDGVLYDSSHGDGETDFHRGDYQAILAGRIGLDNLAESVACAPDVLDVNSSLETAPGVKDRAKFDAFWRAYTQFKDIKLS